MARFWDIAIKNMKIQFRDKKALILLIMIPILYYTLMGAIYGGIENVGSQTTYKVGWVDLDDEEIAGPYATLDQVRNILNDMDEFEMVTYTTNDSALAALENDEIDAYVLFGEGYESYLQHVGSEPSEPIRFYYLPSTTKLTQNMISGTIMGVIDEIVNYNPSDEEFSYEIQTTTGEKASELTLSTPGLLMYGILSSLAGAVILITTERKDGILKRLEVSDLEPKDMIFGHLISNTVMVIVQFTIGISVLSIFGFRPLPADIPSLIIGIAITVLLLSFFQNSLALVISALVKKPENTPAAIWMILIPLLTFSGAFFQLELLAPSLVPYVAWIPTRIVVLLFQDLLVNAVSLGDISILLKLLWLTLEGILFFFIGNKMYRNFVRSTN